MHGLCIGVPYDPHFTQYTILVNGSLLAIRRLALCGLSVDVLGEQLHNDRRERFAFANGFDKG
jgi:hypothetical protein